MNSVILRERSRSPVVLRENPQLVVNRLFRELAAKDAEIASKQLLCDIKQDIIDGMAGAAREQHDRIEYLETIVKEKESRIATLEAELAGSKLSATSTRASSTMRFA